MAVSLQHLQFVWEGGGESLLLTLECENIQPFHCFTLLAYKGLSPLNLIYEFTHDQGLGEARPARPFCLGLKLEGASNDGCCSGTNLCRGAG